jgi:hypothetical protein
VVYQRTVEASMKTIALTAALLGVLALSGGRPQQSIDENQSPGCKMVQDALRESRAIKVGMTRRDLQEHWRLDGGTSIREESRYVYLKCEYIRVDLKFKLAEPVHAMEDLPDDTVTEVSRPYLDYPTMD